MCVRVCACARVRVSAFVCPHLSACARVCPRVCPLSSASVSEFVRECVNVSACVQVCPLVSAFFSSVTLVCRCCSTPGTAITQGV